MSKEDRIKVILTGGHASTTAIAVVEEMLRRKGNNWDLYWIGPQNTIEGKYSPTLASIGLPQKSVMFYPINAGKLQRKLSGRSVVSFIKFPIGFLQAFKLIAKIRPDIVLSFGGYAAFPVVAIAKLFDVPVMLHDQTYSFNRANRASTIFANKIAVSRKTSMSYYPENKTVLTGNPVMTQIFDVDVKQTMSNPPVVFITGGSAGARAINNLVLEVLTDLLNNYYLIHQTGYLDYKKVNKIKNKLPESKKSRYEVYPIIDPMQIDGVYKRSDIIVSRAGANTVSEILIIKRPSILIPLIIGNLNEQMTNAKYAHKYGVSSILLQDNIGGADLLNAIMKTEVKWKKIVENIKDKNSPDSGAAKKVVNELLSLINKET
jgi:UDP-N-acetylglucosamine--N-acetylmuramyl-(pentapeptide) pyrophosphoryl-undecaprenol N-acetylglucosamine transferase